MRGVRNDDHKQSKKTAGDLKKEARSRLLPGGCVEIRSPAL